MLVGLKDNNSSRTLMSGAKFFEGYSRFMDNADRYESWNESVERVMGMHREFYKDKMTYELSDLMYEVEEAYKDKLFLGAQRALQFGGDQLLQHHARLYNCFSEDTSFVTSHGNRTFNDYEDGDVCIVKTHTGSWKKAVVKSYGKQDLYDLKIKKGTSITNLKVTKDHRWLLKDGSETTKLKKGDILFRTPDTFKDFNWNASTFEEKLYWCYGLVYGDGTMNTNGFSKIRLCDHKCKYEERFLELGFKSSSSLSLDGDIIISTGSYKKTSPDPIKDSPELIRAFVSGYLAADGEKNRNKSGKQYISIQCSNLNQINFIRECFSIAGVYILNETELTGQKTNYGVRPYTVKFSTHEGFRGPNNRDFKVVDIAFSHTDTVWCLEVEDDKSFTLNNGIVTGNCASTHCDRSEVFGEIMYMLLAGAGVGFSVQKQHISKLPEISKRNNGTKTFIVEDTIEGWADAIDVLVSSFFVSSSKHTEYRGYKIYFDLSKIRHKGAFISGGFKAPGPDPLRAGLDKIELLIKSQLEEGKFKLKPIIAYDIVMHLADAVISGGVRRSATICMFSKDDKEMLNAKTGDWFIKHPARGRSNNSVMLLRDKTTKEEFSELMTSVKDFGEPGFIFVDDLDFTLNPCVTDDTLVTTSEGTREVKDLIGKQFKAIVDGKEYSTSEKGFWYTGDKEVYRLNTKEGYELTLTGNHELLCESGLKKVKDITLHDKIKLHNHKDLTWGEESKEEEDKGWLLGNLVGDGTFSSKDGAILRYWGNETYLSKLSKELLVKYFSRGRDFELNHDKDIVSVASKGLEEYALKFGIKRYNKLPNVEIEKQTASFYIGYLKGIFDTDGSVQGSLNNGVSIRLTQVNYKLLQQVQRMLLKLGIKSKIYKDRRQSGFYDLPDGNGGYKSYFCNAINELIISRNSIDIYDSRIGFNVIHKQERLSNLLGSYKRPLYKDSFTCSLLNIESLGIKPVYDVTVDEVHVFDANGIVAHNCVEIGMYPITTDGKSGFQVCNLTEINGGKSNSKSKFLHQCKVAAILGTIQAGYTDFKYLSQATKDIVNREALIGVGITGVMNNPDILTDSDILIEGAEVVKYWNKITAEMIGINQAARTTCVKPSGNASVLLETASGIHGEHSSKYIRHVQFNRDTEVAKLLLETNPIMCEDSVWGNDIVVAFPVEVPESSIYKKDLLGVKQLEYVKQYQQTWVEHGTNVDLCVDKRLRHNVSNTITVDDWNAVEDYIYENRNFLCGVSMLSASGDKAYAQAPFTEILTYQQIIDKYGQVALFTSALIEAALGAFNKDLWTATSTCLGFGEELKDDHGDLLKRDFVRRFDKFSKNFLSKEECVNCLKDVYNLHKYWKITRDMKDINWREDLGKKDFTEIDTMGAQACSGGQCEL